MPFTTKIKGRRRIMEETMLLRMFKKEFSDNELDLADVLVIEKSAFDDPGDDYCRFTLKSGSGDVIAERLVEGY